MYLELELQLGEEGEITFICDTAKSPYSLSLRLATGDRQVTIDKIEPLQMGQFVVNVRRLLSMAHEDDALATDDDDDDDTEDTDDDADDT